MPNKVKLLRFAFILLAGFLLTHPVSAQEETDENFVQVSLLTASPSDVLYSCVGHACLRLECPKYNLDYCFTYEGEDVKDKYLTFFSGNLKMGMVAAPSAEYINLYKSEGRELKQYTLNLPIEAKRRLWEILDGKVNEGMNLPYEYMERGCAQSSLQFILQALDTIPMQFAPWPKKYEQTRREFVAHNLPNAPWSKFILYTIVGTEGDAECDTLQKVVIPNDLVEVLQGATIHGRKVIDKAPKILCKQKQENESQKWFTPLLIAMLCIILAIVSCFLRTKVFDIALIAFQTLIGCLIIYIMCISSLPCNDWNWLIVPFNPLPILLWKWRKRLSIFYATILATWILAMIFYPHQITDWAYIALAFALLIIYSKPFITKLPHHTR